MKITTTNTTITIDIKDYKSTYPLNTLSYQITDNGVSILENCTSIATAPIASTTVDGEQLTLENATELLSKLFKINSNNSSNLSLPIEITDVTGLQNALNMIPLTVVLTQEEFDSLTTKNSNTFYYVY